jgi:hypothetical protein
MADKIPLNRSFIAGKELCYISQAVQKGKLAGDGDLSRMCNEWIQEHFRASNALLTHSCAPLRWRFRPFSAISSLVMKSSCLRIPLSPLPTPSFCAEPGRSLSISALTR